MTDYELYQVLDSNNYEPNKENLKILKEGLDTGDFIIVCEDENGDLKFLSDDEKEAIEGYDKIIAKTDDENVKDQLEHIKQEEKNHLDYLETAQKDKNAKYEDDHEIKESFTDYELYKLLEENKYAPTKRNLYILKEALNEGDIEIINETEDYAGAMRNLSDRLGTSSDQTEEALKQTTNPKLIKQGNRIINANKKLINKTETKLLQGKTDFKTSYKLLGKENNIAKIKAKFNKLQRKGN